MAAPADEVDIQILGINDFHGRIAANGQEAGAAVLAGAVNDLRATNPNTVFAAAGDLIGASTFASFIAHDKPTIDALNEAGLEVSAVGNHEFDQGYDDLINRVMAPYDPTTNPYGGAEWEYIGANVRHADDSPALPETWTETFGGVTVGFVGAVTDHLDELVSPAGIAGLKIEAPVVAANRSADKLKADGADIVILLVHEGASTTDISSAIDPGSDFGRIVTGVNDNVDAIISGHTHLAYNHSIPVQGWADEGRAVTERPVVSAGQYGYNLNQINLTFDTAAGELTAVEQNIVALTSKDGAGDWVANAPADVATGVIVHDAVDNAAILGAVPLGKIDGPFKRARLSNGTTENRGGESTLGNLVAEAQHWATEGATTGSAEIAFMNPGGLRADMLGVGPDYPTDLTYKQAAEVQPFANTLINMNLTGAQVKTALEQQWQPDGSSRPFLRLGISEGFTYTYDPAAAAGERIAEMWLNGAAIDLGATYSVTVNSFLATGGDNFGVFADGVDAKDTGQTDLQGMVDFMAAKAGADPLPVDFSQRSVGISFPADATGEYQTGDTLSFELSSLAFTAPGDVNNDTVTVTLGGMEFGPFAVDNTVSDEVYDEDGTVSVSFTVPAGLDGTLGLEIAGNNTGPIQAAGSTMSLVFEDTTSVTDPGGTDPDGTDTDGTDPNGTDPDGTDSDGTDSDGTDPDGTDPAGEDPVETNVDGKLQSTGFDGLPLAGGAALLMLLGLGAMFTARRRSTVEVKQK